MSLIQVKCALLLAPVALLGACSNGAKPGTRPSASSSPLASPSFAPLANVYTYQIYPYPGGISSNGQNPPAFGVRFQPPPASTGPISNSCNQASPCSCNFAWTNVNTTTGTALSVPHSAQVPATVDSTGYNVNCQTTAFYTDQIGPNDQITLSIVSSQSGNTSFTTGSIQFTKQFSTQNAGASFYDASQVGFQDVKRTVCYDSFFRDNTIRNFIDPRPSPQPVGNLLSASSFCYIRNIQGGAPTNVCGSGNGNDIYEGSAPTNADPRRSTDVISAQSYAYNLYQQNGSHGTLSSNSNYACPSVTQDGKTTDASTYPNDSSFSLAATPSVSYPQGVAAFSYLGDGATPNQTCSATGSIQQTSAQPGNSLVSGCLGYAALPAGDGSCSPIRLADGTSLDTFRLRRYVAVFPPQFDTDGRLIAGNQPKSDVVYILDRPMYLQNTRGQYVDGSGQVVYSQVSPAPAPTPITDPLHGAGYRSIYGPKPCPLAYYASTRAIPSSSPSYIGTNNQSWRGTNVDGIALPNIDYWNPSNPVVNGVVQPPSSCSAALPLFQPIPEAEVLQQAPTNSSIATNPWAGIWSIGTVHATNPEPKMRKVAIRPQTPWVTEYFEDLDFMACAPRNPNTAVDPPIRYYTTTSNEQAWCSEVYPTQNSFAPAPANNFSTSDPNANFPTNAMITSFQSTSTYAKVPLLAPAGDIDSALQKYTQYQCKYSRTPTDGANSGQNSTSPSPPQCCPATTKSGHLGNPSIECPAPSVVFGH